MTEKQFKKYEGKKVRVTMHEFPHSIARVTYEGIVEASPTEHICYRDGSYKRYPHLDFYIHGETGKSHLIEWSDVKIITEVIEIKCP